MPIGPVGEGEVTLEPASDLGLDCVGAAADASLLVALDSSAMPPPQATAEKARKEELMKESEDARMMRDAKAAHVPQPFTANPRAFRSARSARLCRD